MEKEFVIYLIALTLKELGFDEECLAYWKNDEIILYSSKPEITQKVIFDNYGGIKAPLWQQCIDWFREEYKLYIKMYPIGINKTFYTYKLTSIGDIELPVTKDYKISKYYGDLTETYQEASEQAILKCIELCKNTK